MDNLEVKKILIEESLRKSQMSQIFDVVSNDKMVFFRSLQQYKNNKLLLGIILDESAYTTITIFFGKVIDESRKDIIIKLINELNGLHNVEKFVLNRNDELLVQVPYVALSQDFNGDIALDLLKTLYHMLTNTLRGGFNHDLYGFFVIFVVSGFHGVFEKAVIVGLFFQHAHAALSEKGIVTGKVGLGDDDDFFVAGKLEGTVKTGAAASCDEDICFHN